MNPSNLRSSYQVWGLTGGIASGKSTAARIFEKQGIAVVDADQIARKLSSEGGLASPQILKRFGTLDRKALRQIVFNDPQSKSDLEKILHPLIWNESLKEFDRVSELAQSQGTSLPIILYEAALLIETGRYQSLDGLIVVTAPSELRMQRLIERDPVSPQLAAAMINAQISDDQRRAAATEILSNVSNLDELEEQILNLIKKRSWRPLQ